MTVEPKDWTPVVASQLRPGQILANPFGEKYRRTDPEVLVLEVTVWSSSRQDWTYVRHTGDNSVWVFHEEQRLRVIDPPWPAEVPLAHAA